LPNREIGLILALLAGLAAALTIGLGVASHAWTSGCIVDRRLEGAAGLCALIGGLLSVGAAVTGLISVINRRHRARGAFLVMGIAALVIGVVGAIFSFGYFDISIAPRAIPPQYLHPC
jgi:energy-converting hydrogenase Eha subunit C